MDGKRELQTEGTYSDVEASGRRRGRSMATYETMGRTRVEPAKLEVSKPLIGVKKGSDMMMDVRRV
jgi:hypothetical protein